MAAPDYDDVVFAIHTFEFWICCKRVKILIIARPDKSGIADERGKDLICADLCLSEQPFTNEHSRSAKVSAIASGPVTMRSARTNRITNTSTTPSAIDRKSTRLNSS